MISQRLKQLRAARGLTLEALASAMDGIVSAQALSKYEQGKDNPSPRVLTRLAAALEVKAAYLISEPSLHIEKIAYRKLTSLSKKEEARIESLVTEELENRVRLQELTQGAYRLDMPVRSFEVRSLEEAEGAANALREQWRLGVDPIASLTGVLEDHYIHVLEIEADQDFHGISLLAKDSHQEIRAAAVVTRSGVAGDRQRFNLAHELGHLFVTTPDETIEEKAAHRFASAFLAPAHAILREVGAKRTNIQLNELRLLKKSFGMSIQALLYRFHDLGIITSSYHKEWCIQVNTLGWRKKEPDEMPKEQPQWLRRNTLRALTEGLISSSEAERLIGEEISGNLPLSLLEKKAFLKLPIEERRRILEEQAKEAAPLYQQNLEWRELQGGDFVEY